METMISRQIRYVFYVFSVLIITIIVKTKAAYQPYKHTDPDFAASVHHLRLLVLSELEIFCIIKDVYTGESPVDMKNYIEDFESSNVASLNITTSVEQFVSLLIGGYIDKNKFADELVKNPFKSYKTIRRFVHFINRFPDIITGQETMKRLNNSMKMSKFPKKSDLEAAMQNVLRLRQVFNLSVADLYEGTLGNMNTRSGLSVQQISEIAEHAITIKMLSHAVDLFDSILQKCGVGFPDTTMASMCSILDLNDVTNKLELAIKEHDKILLGNHYDRSDVNMVPPDSSPYIFDAPLHSLASQHFRNRRQLQIDLEFEAFVKLTNHSKLELDMAASPFLYEKLCRGDPIQKPSASEFRHQCTYLSHTHPYYFIGPLKAEIHSDDPFIVQIYDVISNNEIKELQAEVQQEMRQSRTTATDDVTNVDSGKTSRFRTSANAWIEDNIIDKFNYLNERINLITGFNTTGYYSTEIVQIAAYNPGGHYTPHSDAMFEDTMLKWLPESEFQRGDRIMTFMIYLSDLEHGGGTGFPTLRTVIHPVKGSAVAWYNLNSDGTINYDVLHGGCPVLYGTKWIANKWIRSNDQMFIRPCPTGREPWKI